MILTQCAVCAAELGLSLGKKCGRCSTRYCGPECQVQHWKEGGHDKLCKPIKNAGGAEQYHANNKYAEAVAVAATACAEDTKGQTCYICTQALHWKTKEGLVRGCSCRGTAGFAHVSCLAEQAKILVADAEERNLDDNKWHRWHTCSLCEQNYHGVVACAVGWACWKTSLGRPEADWTRRLAIGVLGNGLNKAKRHEAALSVREAELAMMWRLGDSEEHILITQTNLAINYDLLGRREEALSLRRKVYTGCLKRSGEGHERTLRAASNYASSFTGLKRFEEARTLLRKTMPVARRVLGENNFITLHLRCNYAQSLCCDAAATLDDHREAVATLEEIEPTARRVLGSANPLAAQIERELQQSQEVLRAREASVDVTAVCAALDAMAVRKT
ncbi:unnamed protein product [Pelagomonas calceolata]|uniref:MYND-type domain-containing protein n=1 Tax=Pelagomonas calceolata TaxID=35677 RepID=A0A8J2SGQ1_9STRA|nr:unnamed protein product [Pelagomonas calceolata]